MTAAVRHGRLRLELSAPQAAVKYVEARWTGDPPVDWKYLGDAWERSYGELEWQPLDANREMPWYFLASDGRTTHGYGVMTQPAAMCAWRAGAESSRAPRPTCAAAEPASGWANGGSRSATSTSRRGRPGETPFEAARAFCRQMCPAPRLPKEPVYGFNDWYCDYGKNSAESVLYYASWVSRLAPKGAEPPLHGRRRRLAGDRRRHGIRRPVEPGQRELPLHARFGRRYPQSRREAGDLDPPDHGPRTANPRPGVSRITARSSTSRSLMSVNTSRKPWPGSAPGATISSSTTIP